jgi:hypothetical protein
MTTAKNNSQKIHDLHVARRAVAIGDGVALPLAASILQTIVRHAASRSFNAAE